MMAEKGRHRTALLPQGGEGCEAVMVGCETAILLRILPSQLCILSFGAFVFICLAPCDDKHVVSLCQSLFLLGFILIS